MEKLEYDLRQIILENQRLINREQYFARELAVERLARKATIITGVRRAGKSIYENLYMQKLLVRGVNPQSFCILDLADDRLYALRQTEPDIISKAYYGLFPDKVKEKVYFFFDEVQYLYHWELFINRLQTTRSCEINLTGSSAKLLVKEIATEFGGRSLAWELFPFSFGEFLGTKSMGQKLPPVGRMTVDDENYCRSFWDEYVQTGGFPESILIKDPVTRIKFLQNIAQAVVFRDVIQRYNLGDANAVWRLLLLLLNQMSGLTSLTKLKNRLNAEQYRISLEKIKALVAYFTDAYLIYTVAIFSMNTAVRATNPKKIYCVDHALARSVSAKLTPDLGKILENMVFLHLRRRTEQIYYVKTKSGKEVDFVTLPQGSPGTSPVNLFQVCYELEQENTLERETTALWEAMMMYDVQIATIVTYNTEDILQKDGKQINIVPVWKFLRETQD